MSHLNPAKVEASLGPAFTVRAASPESVSTVLNADEHDDNGRSQFLWIWIPCADPEQGCDLVLAVYPQGDTFLNTEGDHS